MVVFSGEIYWNQLGYLIFVGYTNFNQYSKPYLLKNRPTVKKGAALFKMAS